MNGSRRSVIAVLLVAMAVVVGTATPAEAHSGKQSYLYVSIFDDGVEGRVEIPIVDLSRILEVDLAAAPGGLSVAVASSEADIVAYIDDHMALSDGAGEWRVQYGAATVLATENGPYAVVPFVVEDEFERTPRSFVAELDVVIESDPEKDALLIIEDDWASGVFANGSEPLLGFSVGQTTQSVDLDDVGTLTSMASIRGLGSDAVRIGIDMMLIVAGLVAAIVLLPAGSSRTDIAGPGAVAARAWPIAASFVVAVTVGLWASGLGVVDLPNRVVGVCLALGLIAVAGYGIVARFVPDLRRFGPWLGGAAGLVVGLGLGVAFVASGLDRTRPVVGLLAFEVGALVTMFVIATIVAVPLVIVRRTRFAPGLSAAISLLLVAAGVAWAAERIVGSDWPIEEVTNPLRVWPRNFWFALLAVAIAFAVRWWESRAGRLRPVEPSEREPSSPRRDPVEVGS